MRSQPEKRSMPVTSKVWLGFTVIVWSTLVLSLLTLYAISTLSRTLHEINAYDVSAMQLSEEISKKIYQTTANVYMEIAGGGQVDRPQNQLNEVKMLLESLRKLLEQHPDEMVRAILPMLQDISDAADEYTGVLVNMQNGKDPDTVYLLLRSLVGKGEWLIGRAEHVQLRIWERIGPRLARTERLSTALKVGVALAFAFAFAFGTAISQIITGTLVRVSERIRMAAEAAHAESQKSAKVLDEMHASARRSQTVFQAVVKAFHSALDTSRVSSEASQRIASQMEAGARGTQVLADLTELTANASQKTQATVASLGRRLTLASAIIRETIRMVDNNVETVTRSGRHVEELKEQVDRIEAVLQSITNIADQTELIALEARIASADGADDRRDFGKVAKEIGDLAKMSSAAAAQVRDLMERIKAVMNDVVDSLSASTERVRRLSKQSESVEEAFTAIQRSFDGILELMAEVKEAAVRGASEAGAVQGAMAEILASARQVACQANALAADMQSLAASVTEAMGAGEALIEGVASQARSAEEQSRLAGEVTRELKQLADPRR